MKHRRDRWPLWGYAEATTRQKSEKFKNRIIYFNINYTRRRMKFCGICQSHCRIEMAHLSPTHSRIESECKTTGMAEREHFNVFIYSNWNSRSTMRRMKSTSHQHQRRQPQKDWQIDRTRFTSGHRTIDISFMCQRNIVSIVIRWRDLPT